jgi:hypothetical protein
MKDYLKATANDAISYYLYLTTDYDMESECAHERTIAELCYGGLPTVVCLCGSTRFFEAFHAANLAETLAGKIVLSIGCDMKSDSALGLPEDTKVKLDHLHFQKIRIADEVLILNCEGYIGESTARELAYARSLGKVVRFLEDVTQ